MRLVNVAITRPQQKLIIVANLGYIKHYFDPKDTLRLAVQEAAQNGVIQSAHVLHETISLPPDLKRSFNPNTIPEMLDDRTFYGRFFADLKDAKKQVIIFSPFLGKHRIDELEPAFTEKIKQGVNIDVVYSPKRNTDSEDSKEDYQKLAQHLKAMQIRVRIKTEMHEKIVFIDDNIAYMGSLNVLSHGNTTECMQRIVSPSAIKQYKRDWQVETILALPEKIGEPLNIFKSELPQNKGICPKCSRRVVLKVSKNPPYSAFYGCTGYFEYGCRYTEEIPREYFEKITRLSLIPCYGCKGPTRLETVRKDAWLVCAAVPSCGHGQKITVRP
jgi:hypothetical protein